MDASTYGFIGTLVGAIVGASASVATTFIASWNSSRLQSNADGFQRIERARAFQRETLLRLQEALQDAMRNLAQMHHQDVLIQRETGMWQKSMLDEELNQKVLSVNRELSILTERVSNDELRNSIKEFRQQLANCIFTKSEQESDYMHNIAAANFSPMIEKIGKVLRENY